MSSNWYKHKSISSLAFEVLHKKNDGSDISGRAIRRALIKRLGSMNDDELVKVTIGEVINTRYLHDHAIRSELPRGKLDDSVQGMPVYHIRAVFFGDDTEIVDSIMIDAPLPSTGNIVEAYAQSDMYLSGYAVYQWGKEPYYVCGDKYSYTLAKVMCLVFNLFLCTTNRREFS